MKTLLLFITLSLALFAYGQKSIETDANAKSFWENLANIPTAPLDSSTKADLRSVIGLPSEVKSASFTAVDLGNYVATATLTVTDPTPTEGAKFSVLVTNGTATIGGTAYSVAGTIVERVYRSASWTNYSYQVASTFATSAQGTIAEAALPLTGGTMTGAVNMGGFDLSGAASFQGVGVFANSITNLTGFGAPNFLNGLTSDGTITGTNLSGTNTGDDAVNSLYSGLVTNATHTGDATGDTELTLATVNANVGAFGSATAAPTFTVNGKGLITAAGSTTITPSIGSVTGLGMGVDTALAVNVGTAGSPVVNGGALGTPASGVATNLTGLPVSALVGSTSQAVGFGSIELGHASDTTISRASAGNIAVEGVSIPTVSSADTLTNKIFGGTDAVTTAATSTTPFHVNIVTSASFPRRVMEFHNEDDNDFAYLNVAQFAGGNTWTLTTGGGNILTHTSTDTVTNKRIQPRTSSSTTASTLIPNLSVANIFYRTTQTSSLTIEAPTGTPVIGETIVIYVDSAGAQTLTFNATYKAFGTAFPATTTSGKTLIITAHFNGTNWKTLTATEL